MNTDYFYTTIETEEAEEFAYYDAIEIAQKSGKSLDSVNIVEAM